jgi:hypothetical protein
MTFSAHLARIGALALIFCTLVAPAASADPGDERIDGKYGFVKFQSRGEILRAADIIPDGYGVRAYLRWKGGNSASAWDTKGVDHDPDKRNLSIREGTTVSLTMCYTRNGVDVLCSDYQLGTA